MLKINTFLTYASRAEDAAAFYVSIFPNSRILETIHCGSVGPGPEGSVLTVRFELNGQEYVALNGGPHFSFSQGISLSVECETQAEIDRYWDALLADGGVPNVCGWLTDKFGLSWQVSPQCMPAMLADPDRERSGRAMKAMMGMTKFDIAAMRRACDGM